tara:strand:+ start:152 stop:487 length:336 start_codon:yes stop_codon:yes gene_type:complete
MKLDPQCTKGTIAFAVTNRGHLIPCCRCDDPPTMNDPKFQELLAVSKISDYNSVSEILETKEWVDFYNNLKNHIGPQACWHTCRKNKEEEAVQVIKMIDTKNNKVMYEDKR